MWWGGFSLSVGQSVCKPVQVATMRWWGAGSYFAYEEMCRPYSKSHKSTKTMDFLLACKNLMKRHEVSQKTWSVAKDKHQPGAVWFPATDQLLWRLAPTLTSSNFLQDFKPPTSATSNVGLTTQSHWLGKKRCNIAMASFCCCCHRLCGWWRGHDREASYLVENSQVGCNRKALITVCRHTESLW